MNHYTEPYSYEAQYLKQGIQERNEARTRNNQRYPTYQSNGRTQPVSRQKETEALAMLNDFQRQMNGGQSDPLNLFGEGAANFMRTTRREKSLFQGNPRQDYQPQPNYQRPSPRHPTLNNQKQSNEPQPSVGFNQGFGHQSPFVNAANMMMSPTAQYPMPMQTYEPYGMNMMGGSPLLERKKEPSKAAEIIMAGIEKQNLILAELTGSIHRDRENKMFQESKEIEYRIKQLEFENQGKPSSLFNAGMDGHNRPMLENGIQKYNSLLPGIAPNVMSPSQMMQLAALMQHQRFMPQYGPQFGGMNADMFKHQMKFLKKHEKQVKKEKERKKKSKLKDLLKLLGEDGSGSDDSDDGKDEIVTSKKKGSDDRRGSGSPSRKDTEDKKAIAAERAKLENDKKKQAEDQLKRKKKFKVQGILWARFYPALYWNDFKKRKMGDREEIYSTLSQRIGVNIDNARNWATKATAKGFEALVSNNKLNVALVPYGGKKLNPKDLDPRPAEIQRILKIFMDGLINNTKREIVPSQLLGFLGDITQNYKYPPQNYLFAFEVNRLLFTHNASLKDMTQARVQMICSFFIFIRVFIAEMLLQADKVVPSVKMTDIFVRNIKTFASILVIIMVEYLRSKAVIVSGNQNHLDVDLKIKARSAAIPWNPPMDLKDDPADSEEGASTSKKQDPTEIVISNLYTKEDLSAYFSKKPLVDEIKALCEGWCNAIYEVVNSHYQDELKEKKSKNKK